MRTLKTGGSMTFTSGINKDRPPVPGGSVVSAIAGSFGYFARALALELAPTRVNIVSPGWVDTPMWDEIVGEVQSGFFADMADRLPARRIATPADVAPAYVYLMESEFRRARRSHRWRTKPDLVAGWLNPERNLIFKAPRGSKPPLWRRFTHDLRNS